MKICHFSSVHPVHDNRIVKQCRSLVEAGHSVTLVVASADRKAQEKVASQGIEVVTVPLPSNRWERMFVTTWRVFLMALRTKAEAVQFHDPELIPMGFLLKLLGRKVVYDIHEDNVEDLLNKEYLPGWARRPLGTFLRGLQKLSVVSFDGVFCATPHIAGKFPRSRIVPLQNYPSLTESLRPSAEKKDRDRFVFLGMLSDRRGAREMLEALTIANQTSPTYLSILGVCSPESLEYELSDHQGARFVEFKGWTEREHIPSEMAKVIAGLVLFHPGPNHTFSQPNKLFEYMASGVPVLASDFPYWKRMIDEYQCGICVNPLDPSAIAKALLWLQDHRAEAARMGNNGRRAVETRFNWEKEKMSLLDLYGRISDSPSTVSA